jgi:hypothetical protein
MAAWASERVLGGLGEGVGSRHHRAGGECDAVGWLAVVVVDVKHGERAAQRVTELGEGLRQRVGELGGRPEDAIGVRGSHASVGQLPGSGLVGERPQTVGGRGHELVGLGLIHGDLASFSLL